MGKQLSIYLNEIEAQRLTEIAIRECRRPHDQARYFLLNALGLATDNDNAPTIINDKSATDKVSEAKTVSAFAGNRP
ncbi:hypothetical protein BH10CHL1_BH10CHL1_01610 [soil metagenome]